MFQDRQHLQRALTHRSHAGESQGAVCANNDNERLEFLGDSILGFVASEQLIAHSPTAREGHLSRLKAHLVSADHLYSCALALSIGEHLVLGKGEERNGGRQRKALLADAMEAIIAAIYLDGGMQPAKSFVLAKILYPLSPGAPDSVLAQIFDHKGTLQEQAQALGLPLPDYKTVATEGPEHARIFVVEATVGDRFSARASGSSKKSASQAAAQLLLDQLETNAKAH